MADYEERLNSFLAKRSLLSDIVKLTQDASTREYYRIAWAGSTAIACVYPESFTTNEQSYLDITKLFRKAGLPVAEVLDFDESLGVIILEDLGDLILRNVLINSSLIDREILLDKAIALIPKIQAATQLAYEMDSIASRLSFDKEKLLWELEFFKTHYFTTLKGESLSADDELTLATEFEQLAEHLASKASVLCHRDFHSANLMVGSDGDLIIIDHQDARMGSVTYDLVSLLLDRVTEIPSNEWINSKIEYLLTEREKLSMPFIDSRSFNHEFKMQAVQRCLKAVGTFSFQAANRGKNYFLPFIKPMFQIVGNALLELEIFPTLTKIVEKETYES